MPGNLCRTMNSLTTIFKLSNSIVARRIGQEVILVPIRNDVGDLENIFTLNEVASAIWEMIDGKTTVGEIAARIIEEYEVGPEQAGADVIGFMEQLVSIKAVQEG